MSSKNRSALSRLEAMSADLEPRLRARLDAICADADLHARFLNTLSLMEHIGSRKIMASQSPNMPAQDTLKHLAEETRHAYFFKRAAEKMAARALGYAPGDMIAGVSAAMYMGRLDAHVAEALGDKAAPQAAYLYMSLIVELRAVWFYRIYQAALAARKTGVSLTSVLAEEEMHLDEMRARLRGMDSAFKRRVAEFARFENAQFRSLWSAVEQDCAMAAAA